MCEHFDRVIIVCHGIARNDQDYYVKTVADKGHTTKPITLTRSKLTRIQKRLEQLCTQHYDTSLAGLKESVRIMRSNPSLRRTVDTIIPAFYMQAISEVLELDRHLGPPAIDAAGNLDGAQRLCGGIAYILVRTNDSTELKTFAREVADYNITTLASINVSQYGSTYREGVHI